VDIESLLKSLNARSVEYVIIGATAFPVHGYARATLDIDLFVRPELDNIARLREALIDFGYDLGDLTADDLLRHKVLIRQHLVEADVHPFVRGSRSMKFGNVESRTESAKRPPPSPASRI